MYPAHLHAQLGGDAAQALRTRVISSQQKANITRASPHIANFFASCDNWLSIMRCSMLDALTQVLTRSGSRSYEFTPTPSETVSRFPLAFPSALGFDTLPSYQPHRFTVVHFQILDSIDILCWNLSKYAQTSQCTADYIGRLAGTDTSVL